MPNKAAVLATALMILVPASHAYADQKPTSTLSTTASGATHKSANQGNGHAGLQHRPNQPRKANTGSGKKLTVTKQVNSASPQLLDASWKNERFKNAKDIPPVPPAK